MDFIVYKSVNLYKLFDFILLEINILLAINMLKYISYLDL